MRFYNGLSDTELTGLLQQQDRVAFEEIYRRYWHPLYLHAYRLLDDEDEVQDIIQELFITFWSKPPAAVIHTSLKSYLYTASRNKVLNHIRKNRISHDFISLLGRQMTEKDLKTVQDLELKELTALIDNAINELPPRMKEVFELSRKEFLTHKEIAEHLGTSEKTIKKQITDSLKVLRVKLNEEYLLIAI
jgi:RNA polymerase sigma-70 factor (ECF subfamily)